MIEKPPNYRWPWMLMVVFLFGCLLAVLWMLAEVQRTRQIRNINNPPSTQGHNPQNPLVIFRAVKVYVSEMKAEGQTIPAWVAGRELINRRLLRAEELGDFGGAEIFVSLIADGMHPGDVLMEARFNDGTKIVVLTDGSVNQRR